MPYYHSEQKNYISSTIKKINELIYKKISPLSIECWWSKEPFPFKERTSGKNLKLNIGDTWAERFECAWFNFRGTVPSDAKGKSVVLLLDVSGEMCLFDNDGCPIQGLTNVSSGYDSLLGKPGKRVYAIANPSTGSESIDIWADAGCNDLFGNYCDNGKIVDADIAICNEKLKKLQFDLTFLYECYKNLPDESARRAKIFCAMSDACDMLKNYTDDEISKAEEILAVELNKKNGDVSLTVSAIGHSHLDLAWLWPIRETIRKGARTFSTALKNLEKYPNYIFGASQPQLYQWIKDYYPELYKKIKVQIQAGRWEAQGAMWVEPDTNVTGAESLVRQILYGKRYFKNEFDVDIKTLWLPDVFGYSASLPQLLSKSGIPYFMTQKLSWSNHNAFPHHTFIWRGIDGSEVLAHMLPDESYNSSGAPRSIRRCETKFLDKGICDECLMLYGIGDGGGGPGEEHLEYMDREQNFEGLPPTKQEISQNFFDRQEKVRHKLKSWSGELYLEKHQGTYTSQGKAKKYNRMIETALKRLELALAQQMIFLNDTSYDKEELDTIWKEVMLYQFHDILPGSSISRVYDEAYVRYEELLSKVKQLTRETYSKFTQNSEETMPSVLNTTSWNRNEWVNINNQWKYVSAPALSTSNDYKSKDINVSVTQNSIQNDKISVEFNTDGSIKSILHKLQNKNILKDCGNKLAVYNDDGDCWDINMSYDQKVPDYFVLNSMKTYVDGPCAVAEMSYTYGKSALTQKVVLIDDKSRIDFVTNVDWNETYKMLRTCFPVDVYALDATCDIQFGTIKRPTHRNTSWDMAKYEICAQKWVDISDRSSGVALMSDCKYGYKVLDNTLDINLLRSQMHPGIDADKGMHEFTYSLYPHSGDYVSGEVVKEGYSLVEPLMLIDEPCAITVDSLISLSDSNVVVEAVKPAEDSSDIIIRLYESAGSTTDVTATLGYDAEKIYLTDLMEQEISPLEINNRQINLKFSPFEIITVKIHKGE